MIRTSRFRYLTAFVLLGAATARDARAQEPAPTEPAAQAPAAEPTAPPPPPEPAPIADAPEAPPEPGTETSPLVPSWEEERMAARPVAENVEYVPGDGLAVQSADGEFGLTTRARLQVLGRTSWDDGASPGLGLELRRARLAFAGRFFGEDNRFKVELALSPRDEGIRSNIDDVIADESGPRFTPLLDFYLEFRQLRDLSVRVGEYKVPFSRQRVISSGDLQMVDRSLVNGEFNLDRDVGVDIRSKDFLGLGFLRYYLGAYIARGRDGVGLDDFGLMYIGRLEVLPFGMFDDYEEADFERSVEPRLSLGVAYSYLDRARRERGITGNIPTDLGTTDMHVVAADLMFKFAGLSILSEFMWREGDRNPGPVADPADVSLPRDGFGFMAQAGYLIPRLPIEFAGRYGFVDGRSSGSLEDESELGVAASWYLGRHPFKIQADYFRYWDDAFDAGSHQVRLQLQGSI